VGMGTNLILTLSRSSLIDPMIGGGRPTSPIERIRPGGFLTVRDNLKRRKARARELV
jgi:hypothetical protein